MTSVAIILGAVARIQYLKDQQLQGDETTNKAEKLLQSIKSRIEDAYKEKNARGKVAEKRLVEVSYEIVDAIADLSSKPKEKLSGSVRKLWRKSRNTIKIEELDIRVKDLLNTDLDTRPDGESSSTAACGGSEEIAGGKKAGELLQELRDQLMSKESSSSSLVVCIWGKSGMGKTTVARKLFEEEQARKSNFEVFAWVSINHDFQIKRVLQAILQQLKPSQKVDMDEIELVRQIFGVLEKKKYMLVLDDIWSRDDWQIIRHVLPNYKTSAVIITTSTREVADGVASTTKAHIHNITGLDETEILQILKGATSNDSPQAAGSEKVMKAISDISGGSPLLATILGKSLQTEYAAANDQLADELEFYKPHKGKPKVLEVCYKRLAHESKPCLLYLGHFLPGQEIEVEKLYLLLAAEDLISRKESEIFLESTRDVLANLADRKLIEVKKDIVSTSEIYKSCRVHETVREFLQLMGSSEEFLEIVDLGKTKIVDHKYIRRLAIYLSKVRGGNSIQFKSQDTVKKIGSLLIFDTFESAVEIAAEWPSQINDLKEFICLRVLGFDGVNFRAQNVPKGLDKLVFLRYLSFRGCWLEELPSSVSKLTHLETLDLLVRADCEKMLIPSNIFSNMKRLLHLYLPRLYGSDGKSKLQLQGLERLEILVNFDTEAFDLKGLSKLNKLKILTIISKEHENLKVAIENFIQKKEGTAASTSSALQQLSVNIRDFDRYSGDSVDNLKKLLKCELVHSIQVEGAIGDLRVDSPAPKLAEMILNNCEIENNPMSDLGRFQNLRSLVLSNDAFLGTDILIPAQPNFPTLESLKLHNLQYLQKFTIQDGAVPQLLTLEIDRCPRLKDPYIPKQVRDRLLSLCLPN